MADANANPDPQYDHTKAIAYVPISDPKQAKHSPEVRRLLSRYPGYAENSEWWALCRESMLGGRQWFTARNLPPHLLEMKTTERAGSFTDDLVKSQGISYQSSGAPTYDTRKEYDLRVQQGFRINIVREVIDPYISRLKQHGSRIDIPGVPLLGDFNEAADLARSMSLEDLLNTAIEQAAGLGIYYLGCDSALTPEDLRASFEKANVEPDGRGLVPQTVIPAVQPHAWLIDPTCVLDGVIGDDGMFEEVLLAEQRHNGESLGTGAGMETVFRYWTRESFSVWRLINDGQKLRAQLIEEGPNLTGIVGVYRIVLWPRLDTPWRGRALTEDTVLLDRAMAGVASSLFYSLENDADTQVMALADMSRFTNPADPKLHQYMAGLRETLRSRYGAIHNAIKIEVLNKSQQGKELMLDTYERFLTMELQTKGLGDKVGDGGNESGISRLRRFQIMQATLAAMADERARVHRDILFHAGRLLGATDDTITTDSVVPPTGFDVKSVADLLVLYKELSGRMPAMLEREILLDIVRQSMAEKDENWHAAIKASLADWVPPEDMASLDRELDAAARAVVRSETAPLADDVVPSAGGG